MKTAVIGSGKIVPDFLEAAALVPELEIDAIYGRHKEKLLPFQEQYGIPNLYTDYEELLSNPDIEAVYIALPNNLHYEYARKALEHGKHAIVEKPFASNARQAAELIELAEKNGVLAFEAISNQYMPNYEKTRELLEDLGDIKIIQLNYSQYSSRYDQFKEGIILPAFDPKKAGGALMDINVYNIHYATGLFGKPAAVHYLPNMEKGVDTSGILTMEYPDFKVVCVGAKDCGAPVSINVQGDKGYIHSDHPANSYEDFIFVRNGQPAQAFSLNEGKPRLYDELAAFVKMAENPDSENARKASSHTLTVMEILDEARKQAGIPV